MWFTILVQNLQRPLNGNKPIKQIPSLTPALQKSPQMRAFLHSGGEVCPNSRMKTHMPPSLATSNYRRSPAPMGTTTMTTWRTHGRSSVGDKGVDQGIQGIHCGQRCEFKSTAGSYPRADRPQRRR